MNFGWAVQNWRRVMSPRWLASEIHIPKNTRAAYEFEKLVSQLPEEERLAWHIRHGFRPAQEHDETWIHIHYQQARTRLAVWYLSLYPSPRSSGR